MDDLKNPSNMGAPKKELSYSELKKLMQFKPSLRTTAGWFEVSESTIQNRIKEYEDDPKMTYSVFRDKYMGNVKLLLAQKAVTLALNGSERMIIWCQKNIDNWSDVQEMNINTGEIKIVQSGKDGDL